MESTNNREEGVRLALEDVALIKRVIDRSEVNMRRLGWLLVTYGAVTIIFWLFRAVLSAALARMMTFDAYSNISTVMTLLSYAVTAVLFVLFLIRRREIVRSESAYTMKLFDLWGITLFAPYLLSFIVTVIGAVASAAVPGFDGTAVLLSRVALDAAKYGAVCMSVFVTGLFSGKKLMLWGAGALAMLLPALLLTGSPYLLGAVPDLSGTMNAYGYFTSINALVNLILTAVYLVIGIVFLKKKRGAADGAE